ncbi:MAG: hypothetical protein ABIK81_04545 [candidate division WOR-3 bacterium]
MNFFPCLLLFCGLEFGGYLGELTPFGSLANNHAPSPYISFYLSYPKFPSLEISFSFSRISGKFSSSYFLNEKEGRLLLFLPVFYRREMRDIGLIPGVGIVLLERRLSTNGERRSYPDFYLGVGYREKMERMRFRINLLPNFILETGKKDNRTLTNLYFFFKAELGVGYEI